MKTLSLMLVLLTSQFAMAKGGDNPFIPFPDLNLLGPTYIRVIISDIKSDARVQATNEVAQFLTDANQNVYNNLLERFSLKNNNVDSNFCIKLRFGANTDFITKVREIIQPYEHDPRLKFMSISSKTCLE